MNKLELLDYIVENIPLCRDKITKCFCKNHDLNDEIFDFLESLKENEKKA